MEKVSEEKNEKTDSYDILVVDDDKLILKIAEKILKKNYQVAMVQSGEEALRFLEEYQPKLILLDIYMSGMDGRTTMQEIRKNERWKKIPVIFLTADSNPVTEQECLELGASDFIVKPFVPPVMLSRISRTIELFELRNDLEARLEEKTRLVEKVSLNSIMAIANTIDAKDAYTSGHSVRVAKCSEEIARRLGWSEEDVQNIYHIGLLHDIGKIGVPDAILNKPTRLSEDEFALIKKHPIIGSEILKDIHMIKDVADGALYHHERFDGRGYPFGLSGKEIPLCARIIGIADAYDAMTSNRIYRAKLSEKKVLEEFEKGRGTQFDPELTDLFVSMLREGFYVSHENCADSESADEGGSDFAGESSALLNKVLTEYTVGIQSSATIDALTGLLSRRYAENKIGELLAKRYTGAFLMIDMDNFKYINDTFGHIAGDKLLKLFADALVACTGERDILCRIGGDEFVAFLRDITDRAQLSAIAGKILDVLFASLKERNYEKITSVSIGIAISPEDGKSFEVLYNKADKALYYVKKNGKNSFAFYSEEGVYGTEQKVSTDLEQIRCLIEGRMEAANGALRVEYDEFKQLYGCISRGIRRNGQHVQVLLFTINAEDHSVAEEALRELEMAVASSLRMVDVGTRFSSVQYIVILMDTDIENGRRVADRVIKQFYKICADSRVILSYNIQTVLPGKEG